MAPLDEKHVSFDEPLLVRIVDVDESVHPPVEKKRTRYLALGLLAVVFIGILVGGPAGQTTILQSDTQHRARRANRDPSARMQPSYEPPRTAQARSRR